MLEKIIELRKQKFLFVEDEEELLQIICDALTKLEINYLTARNGKEALDVLAENDDIDIIVTDINMPYMNGLEMIKKIKDNGNTLPIIIMSAHTEEEYIQKAKEYGVNEYLLKPFDFIKFIEIVIEIKRKSTL